MPRLIKSLLASFLVVVGLSACVPEEGSPSSSIPIRSELLPFMGERGYEQRIESDLTVVSKNGVDLWNDRQKCYRHCFVKYIGPVGIEAEISKDFQKSIIAARQQERDANRTLLGLPAPEGVQNPETE